MQAQDSFDDDLITIKPRDFKCPCGKTYLSYAALFTHIKQKHEGKAPGKIIKPPSQHEKRGRPPVKHKLDKKEPEKAETQLPPPPSKEDLFPPETEEEKQMRQASARQTIIELSQLLKEMPETELNKNHLNEIEVFSEMNVHLNTRSSVGFARGNICIADGVIQFGQLVCSEVEWRQFQPFYLLFMLFLQYLVDEENSKKILREANLDLFCEYINDFIEEHVQEMAQYYDFQHHWIVGKEVCIAIFYRFFSWCTFKRYITYKINLNHPQ